MNTVHSLVCALFLVLVTGREIGSSTLSGTETSSTSQDSRFVTNNPSADSISIGISTDDAARNNISELHFAPKRNERLNLEYKPESEAGLSQYSTSIVEAGNGSDDISTNLPALITRKSKLKSHDEILLETIPELSQKNNNSHLDTSQKMVSTVDASVLLNISELNTSEFYKTLTGSKLMYEHIQHEFENNETGSHNASTNQKDINDEDIRLLFAKDDELNKTLLDSWNEIEHFLTSGDLEVGQNAITLLQKYVEVRGRWLGGIKHVSRSNNTTVLLDGTSFEDRKIELKEMVDYLKKLRNIYRLATFVSAMHEYEQKGFLFVNNRSGGVGSWMQEAEKYLKNFENALHDLEEIWKEYNISGHFMFPWDHSYGLISEQQSVLAALNETSKNSTNEFEELESIFRYYVYPCVYFTILLIGIVGNGTLLLMFARHKEIRTGPNVMVLNLALTDVLNLFVNTPLYYVSKFYSEWIFLSGYGCKMFVIFRFAIHSVLAFSIVALSIQRYCATVPTFRRVSASWGISGHLKTFIYFTSVWIAALLCGVPTAVVFEYKHGICFPYVKYQVAVEVLDIFYFILFVFFLPITMIVFSLLTARRLRISVKSIPGEIRNSNQELSRYRSANVVISLAVAYSISHIPRSIWFFMLTYFHLSRRENIYIIFVDEITNYLMFSNSCLNPVALYLASASFKKLFKLYLCRSVKKSGHRVVPLNRQTTASSQSRLMSIVETLTSDFNTSKSSLFEKRQSVREENCVRINVNPRT